MGRQYTDLQLLRSLIEQVGVDASEPDSAEQTVLDLITWLYNTPPGNEAYQQVFDIIAENYSPVGLWEFDEKENN